jgi:hypothetical protein
VLKEEYPMKRFLLAVALIAFAPYAGALAQTPDAVAPANPAPPSPAAAPPASVAQPAAPAGKPTRSAKKRRAAETPVTETNLPEQKKSKKDLEEERKMDHDMHICIGC